MKRIFLVLLLKKQESLKQPNCFLMEEWINHGIFLQWNIIHHQIPNEINDLQPQTPIGMNPQHSESKLLLSTNSATLSPVGSSGREDVGSESNPQDG